ncbi:MAG TPA: LEA type 2 family protein [Arenimonas sp.]|nr:LEA type 2 family protein [Arenimonas sp.]
MRKLQAALALLLLALVAGCASGPPKRIFPPQASLQELRVQPDGQWVAQVRIQNYSTVPMRFSRLEATLSVNGVEATRISIDPGLTVGPGSNELVQHAFTPAAGPRAAVDQALASRRAVRYQLTGRIASSEPETDHPFEYQSALDPVPGLAGILR